MIFDCHTHWGNCFQDRDGLDPEPWLSILDSVSVSHAIVLPFVGLLDAGRIVQENTDVAAVCGKSGGRMLPFCTVNAWFKDQAVAELRRCLGTLKMRGIKFHPWLQGASVSLPAMDAVCEVAAEFEVPILFHDGTPPFSLPSQMALLARRHPKTQIILGHMGLFEHWREALESMRVAPNLWGCMSSPYPEALRQIVERGDRTRLTWGSDHGFNFSNLYPYRLGLMDLFKMDDATRQAIFIDNPRRLLRLDPV